MRSDVIIDVMMAKVKSNLQNHADPLNAALTAGHPGILSVHGSKLDFSPLMPLA